MDGERFQRFEHLLPGKTSEPGATVSLRVYLLIPTLTEPISMLWALKSGGKALGRSREGLTTKLQMTADALRNPV